jgi:hypothetical protein
VFATIATAQVYEATPLLDRLKALRMVYPDGTVNQMFRGFLREQVQGLRPGWQIKLRHSLKSKEKEKNAADKDAASPE